MSSKLCVFISDCDKGLVEANAVLSEHCICAYCCKHFEGNLKDKFSAKEGLLALFWKAARVRLPSGFDHYIAKIEAVNLAAVQYLYSIPTKL